MHFKATTRRGAVLVWFAFIILVFFAMSALVIDVGVTVLAKRQMTGSVEAAALTKARLEAQGSPLYLIESPQRIAEQVFASHYTSHIPSGDPNTSGDYRLGAGAEVTIVAGTGVSLAGGQVVADQTIDEIRDWKPRGTQIADSGQPVLEFIPAGDTDPAFPSRPPVDHDRTRLRRDGRSGPALPRIFSRLLLTRNQDGSPTAAAAFQGVNVTSTVALRTEPASSNNIPRHLALTVGMGLDGLPQPIVGIRLPLPAPTGVGTDIPVSSFLIIDDPRSLSIGMRVTTSAVSSAPSGQEVMPVIQSLTQPDGSNEDFVFGFVHASLGTRTLDSIPVTFVPEPIFNASTTVVLSSDPSFNSTAFREAIDEHDSRLFRLPSISIRHR